MHGRHDGVWRRFTGWALTAVCAVAGVAAAQSAAPEDYASTSVQRIALIDLRSRPSVTPDDYLIADHLLAAAMAFTPDDPELVRSRIRASWSAGDRERVDRLTRRLLALDPKDTVAQLRLASSRIASMQTVEDRLAAYDKLLGPGGRSIDPSVRSRLALDAALLQRERGNFTGFTERLALAMQLDSSNKEAAALAWSSLGPMVESRAERVELLLNLLMADPTDPNVHRQLALELGLAGAFEQARRFHTIALELFSGEGAPQRDGLAVEAAVMRWQVEGPAVVVETLNRSLAVQRAQAANQILQYEQAKVPTDTLPRPEDIRLSTTFNHIRLVAALMIDDRPTIESALTDMTTEFRDTINQTAEASQLSSPQERARRLAELWGKLAQQLIAIAWADMQNDSLTEWANRATEMLGEDSPASQMLQGWRELRFGDPARAAELFGAIKLDTPLNQVGLGLALEAVGRNDEALAEYVSLATGLPLSLSGVWARSQCQRLGGADPLATPERAAAARLADQVPAWVDRMAREPQTFMGLRCDLVDSALGTTEDAKIRVRLTNIAPIPLGVGGDRPINSRLLLSPKLQIGTSNEYSGAQPEVLELDSRLRLRPTESIDITVSPDLGMLGWMAEVGAFQTVRQRWRVLQGYKLDSGGIPRPGALCLETETDRVDRSSLAFGRVTAIELADALEAASESDLPEVLASVRARALLAAGAEYALTADDLARIAAIAAERYPNLSQVGRAMMLSVLPTARMAPGMEAFDAAALDERDPLLVPVALVTRVSDPDSPVLAGWLESETDGLGSFARALRVRLQSPEPTFARLGASSLRPGASEQR